MTRANTRIFQIYYDLDSQQALEPGFLPLDNTTNERPDWREYWPIRNYLLHNDLEEGVFYGFLSTKFKYKTGLAPGDIEPFINGLDQDVDVAILSPFWDSTAFHWNIFEHGEYWHPGLMEIATQFFSTHCGIEKVADIVMTSTNTVYSNFFLAKAPFWKRWLEINERLFALAENTTDDLSGSLNRRADYTKPVQFKVFIMERTASAILATEGKWSAVAYDPFKLKSSMLPLNKFKYEAILSDALKLAYSENRYMEYRNAFFYLRQEILKKVKL